MTSPKNVCARGNHLISLLKESNLTFTVFELFAGNYIEVGVLFPSAEDLLMTMSSCHNLYVKSESAIDNLMVTGGY